VNSDATGPKQPDDDDPHDGFAFRAVIASLHLDRDDHRPDDCRAVFVWEADGQRHEDTKERSRHEEIV
jgi:hypothetical protein